MVASAINTNAAFYQVTDLQDFKSAEAPLAKNPNADATFARASEANFCPRDDLVGGHYWLVISPSLLLTYV